MARHHQRRLPFGAAPFQLAERRAERTSPSEGLEAELLSMMMDAGSSSSPPAARARPALSPELLLGDAAGEDAPRRASDAEELQAAIAELREAAAHVLSVMHERTDPGASGRPSEAAASPAAGSLPRSAVSTPLFWIELDAPTAHASHSRIPTMRSAASPRTAGAASCDEEEEEEGEAAGGGDDSFSQLAAAPDEEQRPDGDDNDHDVHDDARAGDAHAAAPFDWIDRLADDALPGAPPSSPGVRAATVCDVGVPSFCEAGVQSSPTGSEAGPPVTAALDSSACTARGRAPLSMRELGYVSFSVDAAFQTEAAAPPSAAAAAPAPAAPAAAAGTVAPAPPRPVRAASAPPHTPPPPAVRCRMSLDAAARAAKAALQYTAAVARADSTAPLLPLGAAEAAAVASTRSWRLALPLVEWPLPGRARPLAAAVEKTAAIGGLEEESAPPISTAVASGLEEGSAPPAAASPALHASTSLVETGARSPAPATAALLATICGRAPLPGPGVGARPAPLLYKPSMPSGGAPLAAPTGAPSATVQPPAPRPPTEIPAVGVGSYLRSYSRANTQRQQQQPLPRDHHYGGGGSARALRPAAAAVSPAPSSVAHTASQRRAAAAAVSGDGDGMPHDTVQAALQAEHEVAAAQEGRLSAQLGAIGAALQVLLLSRAQSSPFRPPAAAAASFAAITPALGAPAVQPAAVDTAAAAAAAATAAALRAAPVRLLHPLLAASRAAAPVGGGAPDPHESSLGFVLASKGLAAAADPFVLASKGLAAAADPFARLRGHSPPTSAAAGLAPQPLPPHDAGGAGGHVRAPPTPLPSAVPGSGAHAAGSSWASAPLSAAATGTVAWAAAVPASLARSSQRHHPSLAGGGGNRPQRQQQQQQQLDPAPRATCVHPADGGAAGPSAPATRDGSSSALLASDHQLHGGSVLEGLQHTHSGEATQLLESGLGPLLGRYCEAPARAATAGGRAGGGSLTATPPRPVQDALGRAKAALRALAGTVREHAAQRDVLPLDSSL